MGAVCGAGGWVQLSELTEGVLSRYMQPDAQHAEECLLDAQ
jgi:hypothetical protein